jgi:hypothetical protein
MVTPPRLNVTAPATLVVATMVAGEDAVDPGTIPFPPLKTMVGAVVAALADVVAMTVIPPKASSPDTASAMKRFISILLGSWVTF